MTTEPDRLEVMQALKPCPFCGPSKIVTTTTRVTSDCFWSGVQCTKCGVEVSRETKAEAITAWNTRPIETNARTGDAGEEAFQREERYIVIKRKHMTEPIEAQLRHYLYSQGIGIVRGAVIEADWPEYETVWEMIEARVSGIETNSRTGDTARSVSEYSYTELFNAIAAATSVYGGGTGVNISVTAFRAALSVPQSITPPEVGGELVEKAVKRLQTRVAMYAATKPGQADIATIIATLSTPEVVDGTAGLVEALERCAKIVERNLYRQHEKIEDVPKIARAALSQHRGDK